MSIPKVTIVCGPQAIGKSSLALALSTQIKDAGLPVVRLELDIPSTPGCRSAAGENGVRNILRWLREGKEVVLVDNVGPTTELVFRALHKERVSIRTIDLMGHDGGAPVVGDSRDYQEASGK
jgi:hypothetical protein